MAVGKLYELGPLVNNERFTQKAVAKNLLSIRIFLVSLVLWLVNTELLDRQKMKCVADEKWIHYQVNYNTKWKKSLVLQSRLFITWPHMLCIWICYELLKLNYTITAERYRSRARKRKPAEYGKSFSGNAEMQSLCIINPIKSQTAHF